MDKVQNEEEKLQKIGNRLRQLRKQKGYTNYEKFAFEHNISSSQYARYEMGKDIRMSTFLKVLDALGVSAQEFFEGV